ncbi:hypothetical protein DCS_04278 [Drechmeria coniospora]|uniref:C2H2-type domain-containing protein n=1 Tax=Drechmeria coniospora TaxID=98403 RepID=A0A151GJQ9_DRECN|nr:hypothetical protein DCS_04278 [Drechmeria coniospora]KYK57271.1 hypothetical protein DCS_04278 [Drechmeria coniospora]ODA79162.1 hypothetical protein RJ55_04754 [Drechmeria coniospora]
MAARSPTYDQLSENAHSWDNDEMSHDETAASRCICSRCTRNCVWGTDYNEHLQPNCSLKKALFCPGCRQGPFCRGGDLIAHIETYQCGQSGLDDGDQQRDENVESTNILEMISSQRIRGNFAPNIHSGLIPDSVEPWRWADGSSTMAQPPDWHDDDVAEQSRRARRYDYARCGMSSATMNGVESKARRTNYGHKSISAMDFLLRKDATVESSGPIKLPGGEGVTDWGAARDEGLRYPAASRVCGDGSPSHPYERPAKKIREGEESYRAMSCVDSLPFDKKHADHPSHPGFNALDYWNTDLERFKCPRRDCGRLFSCRHSLTYHLKYHPYDTRRHQCPGCGKIFKPLAAVTIHSEAHSARCQVRHGEGCSVYMDHGDGVSAGSAPHNVANNAAEDDWGRMSLGEEDESAPAKNPRYAPGDVFW